MKNPRILHIITTIEFGGAEKQLSLLAQRQVVENLEVFVVPLKGRNSLEPELTQHGVHVIQYLTGVDVIRQVFRLKELFLELKPDIIHVHLPRAELLLRLALFLIPSRFETKIIASRHNAESFAPSPFSILSGPLSRFVTRRFDSIIAISNAVKAYLVDKKEISKKCKLTVVHYGFDLNKLVFQKIVPMASVNDKLRAVVVARFVPQKNHMLLIDAVDQLKGTLNIQIELFGEGPLKSQIMDGIKQRGIERYFSFERTVNIDTTKLSHYDLLILPSRYEGFGLVLLEAMAAGLGIIASNISAIPEVLGRGYPGLFDPNSAESLARKILYSAKAENLHELQLESRRRINDFKIDEVESQIRSVYFS